MRNATLDELFWRNLLFLSLPLVILAAGAISALIYRVGAPRRRSLLRASELEEM